MDYRIREIRKAEYCCLEELLYEAVFVPEGVEPPQVPPAMEAAVEAALRHFHMI